MIKALFNPAYLPLIAILVVCVIPVIILAIVVVVKLIVKSVKRNNHLKKTSTDIDKYLVLFGKDNILSITTNMRRVNVEVKDVNKIDLEALKKIGVGVLISGNMIKCSSEEFATLVEKNK